MEKLIIKLLEISRQLEEDEPGEFDFANLKTALYEFENQAPAILEISREHKVLKNNLILSLMARLRVLKSADSKGSYAVWEELINGNPNLGAERLIEIHNKLTGELNAALSTRPNFRRICTIKDDKPVGDEFKIGG